MKAIVTLFSSCLVLGAAAAQDGAAKWTPVQQKGCDCLMKMQKDGVFELKTQRGAIKDAGFTSLAIAALQSKPAKDRTKEEQAAIDKGLEWVLTNQNEDGSFGKNVPNYTTCAAVMALSRWEHKDKAKDALAKAQRYVLGIQKTEASGSAKSDVEYGGIGYGSRGERADLSNMQFGIEALRNTGLPEDHEALQRALVFLQRTQNLKATNDLSGKIQVKSESGGPAPLAVGDDGGAVYYPGESPAGTDMLPDGSATPRSYGSMTYALLKTYTLCGVKADDPRVKAAVNWIGQNWTLAENPGADPKGPEERKYQGLFYYYMLLAQALDTVGLDKVPTKGEGGKAGEADWRAELRKQLESMQRQDGSWLNERSSRWYENLDMLCTCYALLALEHC